VFPDSGLRSDIHVRVEGVVDPEPLRLAGSRFGRLAGHEEDLSFRLPLIEVLEVVLGHLELPRNACKWDLVGFVNMLDDVVEDVAAHKHGY